MKEWHLLCVILYMFALAFRIWCTWQEKDGENTRNESGQLVVSSDVFNWFLPK